MQEYNDVNLITNLFENIFFFANYSIEWKFLNENHETYRNCIQKEWKTIWMNLSEGENVKLNRDSSGMR